MTCYVFLAMIIEKMDNIYTKIILVFVIFLILINELNTIRILDNRDDETVVERV